MAYLQASDIPGVANADELIAELDVYLALRLPCLNDLDSGKLTQLKDVLVPVVRRWADVGTAVTTSETVGPFQRGKSNGGGHVMWAHELDSLRLLCGQPSVGGALPKGSFPAPEPIDDLFSRRPGWPPAVRR